jgi:LacI family transcriptional regulator
VRPPAGAAGGVTIRDVARTAGVSVTTVSNALNGRAGAMSEQTLSRVHATIRTLSYRPSSIARGLVRQRSLTVGLMIAEITTPLFLQSLNVIEPLARAAGYNVLMCSVRDLDDERRALNLLLQNRVDGIMFFSTTEVRDGAHLNDLESSGPPCVVINRATHHEGFDQINWDYTGGAMAAVDHLAQLGHLAIAHMQGPLSRAATRDRLAGYRQALQNHGLIYRSDYVQPGDHTSSPDTWKQSVLTLLSLSPRPTAIVASDDCVAAHVIKVARRAGLRIPQDLSVIGFDDQPVASSVDPALTTVCAPVLQAGEIGLGLLLKKMKNSQEPCQHVLLPCDLTVRESSSFAPKDGVI